MAKNVANTIYDVKRFIGCDINKIEKKNWAFKIIEKKGKATIKIKIPSKNNTKSAFFQPEEISAFILKQLRKTASDRLNATIVDAVITVPAHFEGNRRKATIAAANIAGFNVLQLIVGPTAAAVAFGSDENTEKDQKILVFDLGKQN